MQEGSYNVYMGNYFVVKRDGNIEPYSEEKVIHTMNRVGVPAQLQPEVLAHVRSQFKGEYLSTDALFKHVFEFLKKTDRKSGLRLNLRRGILDLGPTGFPFERYLARIFQDMGYKTTVDAHLMGECVSHEIDIILEKNGIREIVEVKFHNELEKKTDVHVALYTYARFLDLKTKHKIDNVWIITNTKLTSDAVIYSQCKNIKMLGWNYPRSRGEDNLSISSGGIHPSSDNLQHFVEKPMMYPITILTDLTAEEKRILIEDNIILCRDLLRLTEQEIQNFPLIKKIHLVRAIESARLILS